MSQKNRIGIVGTGFIAKGLVMVLEEQQDMTVSRILTRANIANRSDFPRRDLLVNSVNELIDNSDLVVECNGDVVYATDIIERVMTASLPVVTMDAELHVTTGSYFAGKGMITEAEGDQPGCLAALRENILQMGFQPLVYGNIKGFLNHNPTRDEMEFWARKQHLSLDKTIAFTDGSKIQIEQVLVANGLDAGIAMPGLLGISSEDVNTGAMILAERAKVLGHAISDYILSPRSPAGVFIVAEHDKRQRDYLSYYKLGEGPYYTLLRNYHLCHLEIAKTIRRVLNGGGVLLNNTQNPAFTVAAIAKRPLAPGHVIKRGIGSFDVRGIGTGIADNHGHIPIGLLSDAVVTRNIKPEQQLSFDDVEIQDSLALRAWQQIEKSVR